MTRETISLRNWDYSRGALQDLLTLFAHPVTAAAGALQDLLTLFAHPVTAAAGALQDLLTLFAHPVTAAAGHFKAMTDDSLRSSCGF